MNSKYMFIVAAMAVMLFGATALVTDDAFADKKRHDDKKRGGYESGGQSIAQATDCGNGGLSVANFCQDIGSQNQGKENTVAQAGNQEINIGVELGGESNDDLTSSLLDESTSSVIPEETQ